MRDLLRFSILVAAFVLTLLAVVSFAALVRSSDNEVVGRLLIVPAIVVGLLGVPQGIFFRMSEGWPMLTPTGIAAVYVLPAFVLAVVAKRLGRASRS